MPAGAVLLSTRAGLVGWGEVEFCLLPGASWVSDEDDTNRTRLTATNADTGVAVVIAPYKQNRVSFFFGATYNHNLATSNAGSSVI